MTLLETLKTANIDALKNKNKDARAVLSVVINKVITKEKEHNTVLSDEEVLTIILIVQKELEEEKAGYIQVNNTERIENIDAQLKVVSVYVPKQLSEDEIRQEIEKLSDKSLPNVMKHFKMNFAGRVDLGLVSKVARDSH